MTDIRRKKKIRLDPKGELVDAELIEIVKSEENWSKFDLDDGSTIRFKPIILEVYRVVGQYDNEGNPVYSIKSQNITTVIAPDSIRRNR